MRTTKAMRLKEQAALIRALDKRAALYQQEVDDLKEENKRLRVRIGDRILFAMQAERFKDEDDGAGQDLVEV